MHSEVAKAYSKPGESEGDFRVKREDAVDALRRKYATKMDPIFSARRSLWRLCKMR